MYFHLRPFPMPWSQNSCVRRSAGQLTTALPLLEEFDQLYPRLWRDACMEPLICELAVGSFSNLLSIYDPNDANGHRVPAPETWRQ